MLVSRTHSTVIERGASQVIRFSRYFWSLSVTDPDNRHIQLPIMTSSTVKKFLFTPLIVSAAVFCTLSLPLHVFGAKTLDIKIKDESVFFGELKEFSPLYMEMTGVLSATAGIISLAVMGWRHAGQKSTRVEAELANLARSLKEKQDLLEKLKGEESQLNESISTSGLKPNYEQSISTGSSGLKPNYEQSISTGSSGLKPNYSETPSVVTPLVITEYPVEPQSFVRQKVLPSATAKFASAQTFLGYTQAKDGVVSSPNTNSEVEDSEVEALESQLVQIAQQIASLKEKKLRSNPHGVSSEVGQKNKKF